MRTYHRWISILAALFFLVIAFTGLGLHIDQTIATGKFGDGPKAPLKPERRDRLLSTGDFRVRLNNALDRFEVHEPGARIASLAFEVRNGQLTGNLTIANKVDSPLARDQYSIQKERTLNSEEILHPVGGGWHLVLQEIHAGRQFGPIGALFSIVAALFLLFLSVSGLWMYGEMYRRRWNANRKALFWKK